MEKQSRSNTKSSTFDLERAFEFYQSELLGSVESRKSWYEAYGFKHPRTTSGDWEVFGAILLRQKKSINPYGHDLEHAEIKSCSAPGSSFEYQYHKRGGIAKLAREHTIDHLFIIYSTDYRDLKVRIVNGEKLKDIFEGWRQSLVTNYEGGAKQRFRRSIPLGEVVKRGEIILEIASATIISNSPPDLFS